MATCSADGCSNTAVAHEWCHYHWGQKSIPEQIKAREAAQKPAETGKTVSMAGTGRRAKKAAQTASEGEGKAVPPPPPEPTVAKSPRKRPAKKRAAKKAPAKKSDD